MDEKELGINKHTVEFKYNELPADKAAAGLIVRPVPS
jgi:hypothetical protein